MENPRVQNGGGACPDAPADEACATRILWGTLDARLISVDAETGQPCAEFGNNGEVDMEQGIGETVPGWYAVTSAPTIVRGVAVMGAQVKDGQAEDAPSGVVSGYDMTYEAAVTKLMFLLAGGFSNDKVATLLETDLRGELSKVSSMNWAKTVF